MEVFEKIEKTIVEQLKKNMADEQAIQEGGDRLLDFTAWCLKHQVSAIILYVKSQVLPMLPD